MNTIFRSAAVAAVLATTALPLAAPSASAMPGVQPIPLAGATPHITLTSGGCGPFRHRGFNGGCYPNGGYGYGPGWRRGWHGGYGWHRGWHRW